MGIVLLHWQSFQNRVKRIFLLPEVSLHGFIEPSLSGGVEAASHVVLPLIHPTEPSEHPVWARAVDRAVRRPVRGQ